MEVPDRVSYVRSGIASVLADVWTATVSDHAVSPFRGPEAASAGA